MVRRDWVTLALAAVWLVIAALVVRSLVLVWPVVHGAWRTFNAIGPIVLIGVPLLRFVGSSVLEAGRPASDPEENLLVGGLALVAALVLGLAVFPYFFNHYLEKQSRPLRGPRPGEISECISNCGSKDPCLKLCFEDKGIDPDLPPQID